MELTIIPTWRCNLYASTTPCPYCDYEPAQDGSSVKMVRDKTMQIKKELSPEDWLNWLKSIPASVINFTGGEPLMYSGFKPLVNSMQDKHRWAITSNSLSDVTHIDPALCLTWTGSFHPSAGPVMEERFIRNIMYLRGAGFSMSISIVAHPSTIDHLPEFITKFRRYGLKVGILPFYTRGFDWRNTDKYDLIQKYLPMVEENPNLWWVENNDPKQCSAGTNYLTIQPDGDVWRCYSGFIQQRSSHLLGNIKTGFHKPGAFCDIPCLFPCDWLRCKKGEEAVSGTGINAA